MITEIKITPEMLRLAEDIKSHIPKAKYNKTNSLIRNYTAAGYIGEAILLTLNPNWQHVGKAAKGFDFITDSGTKIEVKTKLNIRTPTDADEVSLDIRPNGKPYEFDSACFVTVLKNRYGDLLDKAYITGLLPLDWVVNNSNGVIEVKPGDVSTAANNHVYRFPAKIITVGSLKPYDGGKP